jgi:regulator of PEP synthase PpsR (kinase-PPPase family)
MKETATLSTIIDARVKDAVTEFCKQRGIKVRYLVEQALIEQLEDEIDLGEYYRRRDEERFSLEEVLAGTSKKKPAKSKKKN